MKEEHLGSINGMNIWLGFSFRNKLATKKHQKVFSCSVKYLIGQVVLKHKEQLHISYI